MRDTPLDVESVVGCSTMVGNNGVPCNGSTVPVRKSPDVSEEQSEAPGTLELPASGEEAYHTTCVDRAEDDDEGVNSRRKRR